MKSNTNNEQAAAPASNKDKQFTYPFYGVRKYIPTGVYRLFVKIDGVLYRESLETTDAEKAKELRDERIKEIKAENAAEIKQGPCSFKKLLGMALEDLNRRERLGKGKNDGLSKGGADCYRFCEIRVRKYVKAALLETPIKDIKTDDLESWLALMNEQLSNSVWNCTKQFLIDAFEVAIKEKLILQNPAKGLHHEKKKKKTAFMLPSEDELDELIAEIKSQQRNSDRFESADFVFFLSRTGARVDETSKLLKSNVDLDKKQITFADETGDATNVTKNGNAKTIQILPELVPVLERCMARKNGKYVFGLKRVRQAIIGACERLSKKAIEAGKPAIPNYKHHTFRHFFATFMLNEGFSFPEVAKFLGHSDGGMELSKTYAHILPKHLIEAFNKVRIGTSKDGKPQEKIFTEEEVKARIDAEIEARVEARVRAEMKAHLEEQGKIVQLNPAKQEAPAVAKVA